MPPLCTPTAATHGPALQPGPLGLPRGRTWPQPLPPLRGTQPAPTRTARDASRAPPAASQPSFFGPLTDTIQDYLGGHYAADPADHAWTIAMATGDTSLPLHSPPLRHSEGGWNVAARHIFRALYLHNRDLHFPEPQLPFPPHSSPGTGSMGGDGTGRGGGLPPTHLPPIQHRSRPAERSALLSQRTPLPSRAPPSHPAEAPRGRGCFRDTHLHAPSKATTAQRDPTVQRADVRSLKTCLREAHCWHTHAPSAPRGPGGPPAPDTHQTKKAKTHQETRQLARQQDAAPRAGPGPSHVGR